MTDRSLQASVTAELACEPKVESDDIAVSTEGSVVTLCGTVTSVGEKHQAQDAAQRADGVSSISNKLLVRAMDPGTEVTLRAAAWQAFMFDSLIPQPRAG